MLDEEDEHVVDPAQQEKVRAKEEIDHAQPEGHLVGDKNEEGYEDVIRDFPSDIGIRKQLLHEDECQQLSDRRPQVRKRNLCEIVNRRPVELVLPDNLAASFRFWVAVGLKHGDQFLHCFFLLNDSSLK